MTEDIKRPEWVPENACKEYTTSVMKGVNDVSNKTNIESKVRRRKLSLEEYIEGVKANDRTVLARAITLIESNSMKHIAQGQDLLKAISGHNNKTVRIGITGVPGAGKSSLIEVIGNFLIDQGFKVAVLAVDPSSSITKGSVLGDKTRMETLARNDNCFIRPSPSGGTLGGVTRKTRDTIQLCEAAGYDVILVETVGVGQNEVTVRSMVDFFLLIKIAGAGDELQGIKKGVIELADAIAVNKADGDNITAANIAREEFKRALHYLTSPTESWTPQVLTCSAVEQTGIREIWDMITEFISTTEKSGVFEYRRDQQRKESIHETIKDHLLQLFYNAPEIKKILPELEDKVVSKEIPVTKAVQILHETYFNK